MTDTSIAPPYFPPANWRGVGFYLLLCFGLTWSIEITALLRGVRFAVLSPLTAALLASVMFIPTISAFIVRRWLTREGFASAGLQVGPWKPYLFIWAGIPCLFFAIYTLTFGLDLGSLNPSPIATLKLQHALPPGKHLPPDSVLLALLALETFLMAPLFNLIATFGEEFGWTGYLLPNLLYLGKWRAVAIYGVVWGLWHAPVVIGGFNFPGHPISGIFWMCAFTTAIGLIQCALLIRCRSVFLTSFLHATMNANASGIWRMLAKSIAAPWGGPLGLVGILLIASVGLVLMVRTKKDQPYS